MNTTACRLCAAVACLMLVASSLAWGACGNELVNEGFEVAAPGGPNPSYNNPSSGYSEVADQWWLASGGSSSRVQETVDIPAHEGEYYIQGQNAEAIWQIFDESQVNWVYDDDTDTWNSESHDCWIDDGDGKWFELGGWVWFTDLSQSVSFNYGWWCGSGDPPESPDDTGWSVGAGFTASPSTEENLSRWIYYGTARDITDCQPQYVYASIGFVTSEDTPYLDDMYAHGDCYDDDHEAPEPATWVLLACTGAIGAVIRRRRE